MAVSVVSGPDSHRSVFPDGTGWVVDDTGHLHVIKAGDGNLATFHAGHWSYAQRHNAAGA